MWKATEKHSGQVVALKKIFDAFRNQTDAQRTFREIMFLQDFADHPNIIRLFNVMKAENDKDIYLVFEFMGELFDAITVVTNILSLHWKNVFCLCLYLLELSTAWVNITILCSFYCSICSICIRWLISAIFGIEHIEIICNTMSLICPSHPQICIYLSRYHTSYSRCIISYSYR